MPQARARNRSSNCRRRSGRTASRASLGPRAAVVAAGPIANFILAIVIFTAIFGIFGERITAAKVDIVNPGSAAERAGFLPGDKVISIDGQAIESFSEMQRIVGMSPDQPLHFVVERDGKTIDITATPERKEITDNFGNVIRLGLLGIQRSASPDDWTLKRHDPVTAFVHGGKGVLFRRLPVSGLSLRRGHGAGIRRPAGRSHSNRPSLRSGCDRRLCRAAQSCRDHLCQYWAVEFVPDTDARWRSSSVLRASRRSGAGL